METVKPLISFPDEGIEKGEVGTIVAVFTMPNEAYEVKFVNNDGTVRAMFAILAKHIERTL